MPYFQQKDREYEFSYNIPEYFFKINSKDKTKIFKKKLKVKTVDIENYESLKEFTKKN